MLYVNVSYSALFPPVVVVLVVWLRLFNVVVRQRACRLLEKHQFSDLSRLIACFMLSAVVAVCA